MQWVSQFWWLLLLSVCNGGSALFSLLLCFGKIYVCERIYSFGVLMMFTGNFEFPLLFTVPTNTDQKKRGRRSVKVFVFWGPGRRGIRKKKGWFGWLSLLRNYSAAKFFFF